MSIYRDPELITVAEDAHPGGRSASLYLSALASFPAETGAPAIERPFSRPEIAKQLADNPWQFHGMPCAEPSMFQNVARIFDSALGSKEKEKFLGAFGGVDPMFGMMIDFYLGDLGAGSGRVSDAGNATHPFCKRGCRMRANELRN